VEDKYCFELQKYFLIDIYFKYFSNFNSQYPILTLRTYIFDRICCTYVPCMYLPVDDDLVEVEKCRRNISDK
jgi:hypothetical protein